MAKFAEGQLIRVSASNSSAPKALRDQVGVIKSVVISQVPADFMAAHALEDSAEQMYNVKFDFDEKVRKCGESQLETA
jgi:hypothetical protein